MSKLSVEDLRKKMADKIANIPTPVVSQKRIKEMKAQNARKDRETLTQTMKILEDRRQEAHCCGDRKKLFATIAVERAERDKFNVREDIRQLETKLDCIQKSFPENIWTLLQTFSELKDPDYWKRAKENGYTEQDIALYYRDVWGLAPKMTVKFIEYLNLRNKIKSLQVIIA